MGFIYHANSDPKQFININHLQKREGFYREVNRCQQDLDTEPVSNTKPSGNYVFSLFMKQSSGEPVL